MHRFSRQVFHVFVSFVFILSTSFPVAVFAAPVANPAESSFQPEIEASFNVERIAKEVSKIGGRLSRLISQQITSITERLLGGVSNVFQRLLNLLIPLRTAVDQIKGQFFAIVDQLHNLESQIFSLNATTLLNNELSQINALYGQVMNQVQGYINLGPNMAINALNGHLSIVDQQLRQITQFSDGVGFFQAQVDNILNDISTYGRVDGMISRLESYAIQMVADAKVVDQLNTDFIGELDFLANLPVGNITQARGFILNKVSTFQGLVGGVSAEVSKQKITLAKLKDKEDDLREKLDDAVIRNDIPQIQNLYPLLNGTLDQVMAAEQKLSYLTELVEFGVGKINAYVEMGKALDRAGMTALKKLSGDLSVIVGSQIAVQAQLQSALQGEIQQRVNAIQGIIQQKANGYIVLVEGKLRGLSQVAVDYVSGPVLNAQQYFGDLISKIVGVRNAFQQGVQNGINAVQNFVGGYVQQVQNAINLLQQKINQQISSLTGLLQQATNAAGQAFRDFLQKYDPIQQLQSYLEQYNSNLRQMLRALNILDPQVFSEQLIGQFLGGFNTNAFSGDIQALQSVFNQELLTPLKPVLDVLRGLGVQFAKSEPAVAKARRGKSLKKLKRKHKKELRKLRKKLKKAKRRGDQELARLYENMIAVMKQQKRSINKIYRTRVGDGRTVREVVDEMKTLAKNADAAMQQINLLPF